jgi:hypothetical protein
MENFQPRKSDHQTTSFTTHATTKSPQKYHDLPPQFPKTPCKNTTSPHQEKKAIPSADKED